MPLTLSEVQSLAPRKIVRLARSLKLRERLQKAVDAIQTRIAGINETIARTLTTAATTFTTRKTRATRRTARKTTRRTTRKARRWTRARSGKPLSHYMQDEIKKAGKPLTAGQLADRVIAAGFPSKSKHIRTAIFSTVNRNPEVFDRVARGTFDLIKEGKAAATKA